MPSEDFGWAYKSPGEPDPKCRWCGRDNVMVQGVVICHGCDNLKSWPSQQTEGVEEA